MARQAARHARPAPRLARYVGTVAVDDAAHWEALVIERRYVRDSIPGRPCADVVRQVVAVRDEERAALAMGGSDFAQRIRRWDWCGNPGSEDYAAPYLWLNWQRDDRSAQASDGVAHVDPLGQLGGECEFLHNSRRPDPYRVDCERVEFRVGLSATLETEGAIATPRRVRVEPQIVPGVRFTVHCNEYASEWQGVGGCMPPRRP